MLHVDEASWRALGEACEPVLRRGEAFEAEWPLRHRDGRTVWALLHGRAIDAAEPSLRIIWTMLDMIERRRAVEDMQRALAQQRELGELKSRFVAMTSHEFRTPLAAILSSAGLLRDCHDRLPAAEREELLAIVQSSVRRMGGMLDDVLALGRAGSQAPEFAPAPLGLRPVVEQVLADARRAAVDARHHATPVRLLLRGSSGSSSTMRTVAGSIAGPTPRRQRRRRAAPHYRTGAGGATTVCAPAHRTRWETLYISLPQIPKLVYGVAITMASDALPATMDRTHPMTPRLPTGKRQAAIAATLLDLADDAGPAATTTADIAGVVGISQGAVFKHFPTKEAIGVAAMRWVREQLLQGHRRLLAQTLDAAAQVGQVAPAVDRAGAALAFLGLVQGLVLQSMLDGRPRAMRGQADGVLALYPRGLGGA
jgi:hypothetical protein